MWFKAEAERTEARFREQHRSASLRRAHRLPESFRQHIGAGWDARYGIPIAPENHSPVALANTFARQAVADFGAARVAAAYDEEKIRDYAENYARLCGRMGSLESRRSFGLYFGILPPTGKKITRAGELARWDEPMWWRRQLRKVWTRAAEDAMRAAGIIRRGKAPYASDEAVEHRTARQARTLEWLESRAMVNEAGEQLPLLDLHKRSLANPALRRGEFMCRMRGFEEIAADLKHVALFWTLTAPSAFHAQHAGGGINKAWDAAERPRVRDAQDWLCKMWARARAKLARLSILFYGFRVAEPHHDATPHWHMVLFLPAGSVDILRAVLRGVWLSDYASEPGAAEFRSKCITIEPERGSATGYVAKYVSKNIDGAGEIGDAISDETGQKVSDGVARVAAWASCHGIRQFQQVGGPPVGLWRECRRARSEVADADIERARKAADRGDWRGFIYALSCDHIKAGRRVALKLERAEEIKTRFRVEVEGPARAGRSEVLRELVHGVDTCVDLNSYGEQKAARIVGLRYCSTVVVTRPHRWRIEKKITPKGAVSVVKPKGTEETGADRPAAPVLFSRSCSGLFSGLGPVAITVRGPDRSAGIDFAWVATVPYRSAPALGDPAAWTSRETSTAGPILN